MGSETTNPREPVIAQSSLSQSPKAKDHKETKDQREGKDGKDGKDGKGDADKEGKEDEHPVDSEDEEEEEEDEEDPVEQENREKEKYRQSISDLFPTSKGITISLICRILYQTDKESLVNAASKSIDAHLRKLEGEGKVRRINVKLPFVTEGKIGEAQDGLPGWECAGEIGAEEVVGKGKVKVD